MLDSQRIEELSPLERGTTHSRGLFLCSFCDSLASGYDEQRWTGRCREDALDGAPIKRAWVRRSGKRVDGAEGAQGGREVGVSTVNIDC